METPETYEETYFYGIHDNNQNQAKFTLTKETDNEEYTSFTVDNIKGSLPLEDMIVVEEIAINLTDSIGKVSDFDSVRGETFFIQKLTKDEFEAFI